MGYSSKQSAYNEWRCNFLYQRLRLGIIVSVFILLSFFFLGIEIIPITQGSDAGWIRIILHQCVALVLCLILLFLPFGKRHPGVVFILFSWTMTLPFSWDELARGYIEPDFIPWTLTFLSQATLAPVYWQLHALSQLGLLVMLIGLYQGLDLEILHINIEGHGEFPTEIILLYMIWFCVICNVSIYLYEKLQRSEFKTHLKLAAEHDALKSEQHKSERLLLNILPAPIAERLKQQEDTIAENHPAVTIVFADIVRFTELSNRTTATQLVALLNQVFSEFDQLAEQYQLEKIKTIGDAYMAVAGLPEASPQHVENAIRFALAMQQALHALNTQYEMNLDIRVGIHTGAVVAGVIGLTKFSYDLWGDNVNIASRMESHGLPGKIHVSAAVYTALQDSVAYRFIPREKIVVKGKGEMSTYWVEPEEYHSHSQSS